MLDIVLMHKQYSKEHLQTVIAEMRDEGAPSIHCIYDPANEYYVALEGCHRLRAAEELGVCVAIIEIEYSDDMLESYAWSDSDSDYTVADVFDTAARRYNDGIYVSVNILD